MTMQIEAVNPLKWLLAQLPAYVAPERLPVLLAEFDENKQRYTLTKIRAIERKIANARRWTHHENAAARIVRWEAQIAKLREGQ